MMQAETVSEVQVKFIIPGEPISLARARYGNGNIYDPQKNIKLIYGIYLQQQHNNRPLYTQPIALEIIFYFKIPKIRGRKMVDLIHTAPPDIDNLIKMLLDAGKDILWSDDRIVSQISASKFYSKEPHTEFTITTLRKA